MAVGIFAVGHGWQGWHKHTQKVDDEIKGLQLRKLQLEVADMERASTERSDARIVAGPGAD